MDDLSKQIEAVIQSKIVHKMVEAHRAIGLTLFQYITANSQVVGLEYGSPVLTGRYYTSHRISLNSINTDVSPPNPDGADKPYKGIPLSLALTELKNLKLGDTIYVANSLDYAQSLENGYSWKAPEGVYGVAAEAITVKFRNVRQALGALFKQ